MLFWVGRASSACTSVQFLAAKLHVHLNIIVFKKRKYHTWSTFSVQVLVSQHTSISACKLKLIDTKQFLRCRFLSSSLRSERILRLQLFASPSCQHWSALRYPAVQILFTEKTASWTQIQQQNTLKKWILLKTSMFSNCHPSDCYNNVQRRTQRRCSHLPELVDTNAANNSPSLARE